MSPVRSTRKIIGMAAVLAVISATMVVGAIPAQADGYCPSGRVCMWEDSNFSGDRWVDVKVGGADWSYNIDGWNGDNEISSIDNASGWDIRVWGNDNPTGASICVPAHSNRSSLGSFNDDAEYFETGC